MQLDLFQWDLIETGKGQTYLSALNFQQAEFSFSRILQLFPHHHQACSGLSLCRKVESLLQTGTNITHPVQAASYLWQAIITLPCPDTPWGEKLKHNLLKYLLEYMHNKALTYIPPDLCTGYLYYLLGDQHQAEQHLQQLLHTHPEDGLLSAYLADTYWQQEKKDLARGLYTDALLSCPELLQSKTMAWQALQTLIEEKGALWAPLYGYLQGKLPLRELTLAQETQVSYLYAQLRRAEAARRRQDYATSMEARRELQQTSPLFFKEYLAFLKKETPAG